MAGIYIHIPYCKQACHYCNFHFSTATKNKGRLLNALAKEIAMRKDYLAGERVNTIYSDQFQSLYPMPAECNILFH